MNDDAGGNRIIDFILSRNNPFSLSKGEDSVTKFINLASGAHVSEEKVTYYLTNSRKSISQKKTVKLLQPIPKVCSKVYKDKVDTCDIRVN